MDLAAARATVLTRTDLEAGGITGRQIEHAVDSGGLVRVHHGCYVTRADWAAAYAEGRHLMQVAAAQVRRRGRDAPVMLASAAVLWGLPLYRMRVDRVHICGASMDGWVTRSRDMARHEVVLADDDLAVVGGIPCTSLPRTLADVLRMFTPEAAIAAIDAGFRQCAYDPATKEYDLDEAERLRADVFERLHRMPRARGVRQARSILSLADGRADRPGESVSRLQLIRLGFARPRVQVPIPGPDETIYYVDLGIDDANAWGEFDGKGKYLDPDMRGDRDAHDVLLAEKEREDWVRSTTHRRMPRWGSAHILTPDALAARLAAFHVFPPR